MGWKNLKDFRAYQKRKSMRYAREGIKLEERVAQLLEELKIEGMIQNFVHHEHYSFADLHGKDFTASRNGTTVSFGVTISLKHRSEHKNRYPTVPQLCFPIGTNPDTMKKRIMQLFQKTHLSQTESDHKPLGATNTLLGGTMIATTKFERLEPGQKFINVERFPELTWAVLKLKLFKEVSGLSGGTYNCVLLQNGQLDYERPEAQVVEIVM